MEPYELLNQALTIIEDKASEKLSIPELAEKLYLSSTHLQRIFKFAFNVPLASYIRSRRLASSINELIETDLKIIDIANEYDFPYEQSYIRAFRKEFGITPGELRKSGEVIKITPPLALFDKSKIKDGALFGPDIVMVPGFRLMGKREKVSFDDSIVIPPVLGKRFWDEDRKKICNVQEPNAYYGLTRIEDISKGYSYYMPSVRVKEFSKLQEGFDTDDFPTSMCMRFRYIGKHHYYDINVDMARGMYDAIVEFANFNGRNYKLLDKELYFERIDTSAYDGTYCQMEWYTPIFEI